MVLVVHFLLFGKFTVSCYFSVLSIILCLYVDNDIPILHSILDWSWGKYVMILVVSCMIIVSVCGFTVSVLYQFPWNLWVQIQYWCILMISSPLLSIIITVLLRWGWNKAGMHRLDVEFEIPDTASVPASQATITGITPTSWAVHRGEYSMLLGQTQWSIQICLDPPPSSPQVPQSSTQLTAHN